MVQNKCLNCHKIWDDAVGAGGYCSEVCYLEYRDNGPMPEKTSEQERSEQIKRDYEFTEVEVQKINLQPGDTLMVTIKNNYIDPDAMRSLNSEFKKRFPNNQVFVFGMDIDGDVKLAVVSQPEIKVETPVNLGYCTNCDCGKKDAAEGKNEKE